MTTASLLLVLLTVSECSSHTVFGRPGQDVALPCQYNIQKHGPLWACWGRGEIPNRGCHDEVIATDGQEVTEGSRALSRYQLLGRLDAGDVSMTIVNVTEEDAGRYGCRIQIPGLFNDHKQHVDLIIERAPPSETFTTTDSVTQLTSDFTTGPMNPTGKWITSSLDDRLTVNQHGDGVPVVQLCVALALVTLLTVSGIIVIAIRRNRRKKISRRPVLFRSSTLRLRDRGSTVENVYQMDAGSEYESVA